MLTAPYLIFALFMIPARYFIIAGIFYLLFYFIKRESWIHLKIQKKFPPSSVIRSEIFYSFITMIIFALVALLIFRLYWAGYALIYLDIDKYGVRNSLLVAPMPTASTSQILGNNECFEPFTSNIYVRRTLAGEFIVINKYLIRDLIDIGVWNTTIKDQIIANNGSVQNIEEVPQFYKNIYKTVWELSNKTLIDMAADRGAFIDQSQSLNLFMAEPNFDKLSSMHFYSWKKGLKTGIYYLRTKPVAQAQQFTIDPTKKRKTSYSSNSSFNNEICESCSS